MISVSSRQHSQQIENLDVEPDEGHEQREGAVPFVVFRQAFLHAAVDELVVHEEAQRRDADDDEFDGDGDDAAVVQHGEVDAEEAEHHFRDVREDDARQSDHRDAHELRVDRHEAARVDESGGDGDAEGQHDGID